jgi:hypothetical protein
MWNVEFFHWNEEHARTLRALRVTPDGPGTILRDFAALLEYVRERDLAVSKARQHPPLKVLPEMNALLTHPTEARLKRPVLKSYPHLQGLYLLLRASGLAQVSGGSKPTLAVDETILGAWSALNPTEQYFTLLETWLLRGDAQIVGERAYGGLFFSSPFNELYVLLTRIEDRTAVADERQMGWNWHYSPGRMGFALLELFGFVTVETRPPEEGETWIVDYAQGTPLGEAVFALIHKELFSDFDAVLDLEAQPPTAFGALQPIFAPYQPPYQHTLALPAHEFRPGRYTFRASLAGNLWRRIEIDAREELDRLARTILRAYDFDYDHLYAFTYRNAFGAQESVNHPYMDEGPSADEVRVGDLPLAVGTVMDYTYDFGDNWEFEVKLEGIKPAGNRPTKPEIVEERGESPEQYPSWGDEDEW